MFVYSINVKRFDPLHPISQFCLYVLLGFVAPMFSVENGNDIFSSNWSVAGGMSEEALTFAMWLGFLSLVVFAVAFGCGSALGGNVVRRISLERFSKRAAIAYTVTIACIVVTLFSVGVYRMGGPSVLLSGLGDRIRLFQGQNYFIMSVNALLAVAMLWWYRVVKDTKHVSLPVVVWTLVALGICGLQGSKSVLFVFVMAIILMVHTRWRRISVAALTLIAVGLQVSAMAYEIVMREIFVVGEIVSMDFTSATYGEMTGWLIGRVMSNFSNLQVTAVIIDHFPDPHKYVYGESYLSFFTIPIPSSLWPEKLLPSTGILARTLWPEIWARHGTTMPPGMIGECYLNAGWVGVLLGSFAFGCAYGVMWKKLRDPGTQAPVFCACILGVALLLHYFRGEFVAPSVLMSVILIPLLIGLKLTHYRSSNKVAKVMVGAP